jgi:hypothetical protein
MPLLGQFSGLRDRILVGGSTPRRAILGVIPRRRSARRQRG